MSTDGSKKKNEDGDDKKCERQVGEDEDERMDDEGDE